MRLLLTLTATESAQYLQARRSVEDGSGSHHSASWVRARTL